MFNSSRPSGRDRARSNQDPSCSTLRSQKLLTPDRFSSSLRSSISGRPVSCSSSSGVNDDDEPRRPSGVRSPTLARKLKLDSISSFLTTSSNRFSIALHSPRNHEMTVNETLQSIQPQHDSLHNFNHNNSQGGSPLHQDDDSFETGEDEHTTERQGVGGVAAGEGRGRGAIQGLQQDDDWRGMQKTVLGIFQHPGPVPPPPPVRLEPLGRVLAMLESRYSTSLLHRAYTVLVCKGMMVLRETLKDTGTPLDFFKCVYFFCVGLHVIVYFSSFVCVCILLMVAVLLYRLLADTWGTFYTNILPLVLNIFCIPNGRLYPLIRAISLTAFRDHVVMYKTVKNRLVETFITESDDEMEDSLSSSDDDKQV